MKRVIEVSIDDLEYDNGYGGVQAALVCDVEVEKLPSTIITTVKDGQWFLIDNDGGVFKHLAYDCGTHDEELQARALKEFMR